MYITVYGDGNFINTSDSYSHDVCTDSNSRYEYQPTTMQLLHNAANNPTTLLCHKVEPAPLDSILPIDALIAKPATVTY